MATSTRPVFLMRPVRARILVPLLPLVPLEANQDEPFNMIAGTLAQVSTLFKYGWLVIETIYHCVNIFRSRFADFTLDRSHQS